MMNKLIKWGGIAFVLFLVATAPATAASLAEDGGGILGQLASGFADMLGEWAN